MPRRLKFLPLARNSGAELAAQIGTRRPAVFLDYDGTLTPIVARPDLAIMTDAQRAIVRALAKRCPVAIVSGRDRPDVEQLVAIDNLIYAGSHGFDIASPDGHTIQNDMSAGFGDLMETVATRLRLELDGIEGALVEPKKASIAAHYRLVAPAEASRVKAVVDAILAEHDNLKMTPGKMVYEIQPKIDWNKGKAVLWLLDALGLAGDDVVPIYLGDDITDEDAFLALATRSGNPGIGIYVGDVTTEINRPTAAHYYVETTDDAGQFLDALARE